MRVLWMHGGQIMTAGIQQALLGTILNTVTHCNEKEWGMCGYS